MKKILNSLINNKLLLILIFISTINLTNLLSMDNNENSDLLANMNPEAPKSILKDFIKSKSESSLTAVLNLLELIKEAEPHNFDTAENLFQAALNNFGQEDFKKVHDFTVKFYKDKLSPLQKNLDKINFDRKKIDIMISQLPNREAALKEIAILSQQLKDKQQELNRTNNIINTLSNQKAGDSEIDISSIERENNQIGLENKKFQDLIEQARKEIRDLSKPKTGPIKKK